MLNTNQTVHPYKLGDTEENETIEVLPAEEPLSVPTPEVVPAQPDCGLHGYFRGSLDFAHDPNAVNGILRGVSRRSRSVTPRSRSTPIWTRCWRCMSWCPRE